MGSFTSQKETGSELALSQAPPQGAQFLILRPMGAPATQRKKKHNYAIRVFGKAEPTQFAGNATAEPQGDGTTIVRGSVSTNNGRRFSDIIAIWGDWKWVKGQDVFESGKVDNLDETNDPWSRIESPSPAYNPNAGSSSGSGSEGNGTKEGGNPAAERFAPLVSQLVKHIGPNKVDEANIRAVINSHIQSHEGATLLSQFADHHDFIDLVENKLGGFDNAKVESLVRGQVVPIVKDAASKWSAQSTGGKPATTTAEPGAGAIGWAKKNPAKAGVIALGVLGAGYYATREG